MRDQAYSVYLSDAQLAADAFGPQLSENATVATSLEQALEAAKQAEERAATLASERAALEKQAADYEKQAKATEKKLKDLNKAEKEALARQADASFPSIRENVP